MKTEARIKKLKEIWKLGNISSAKPITEVEISLFQNKKNVLLPSDLVEYFKTLNGSNDEYDDNFFKLYSLEEFKTVSEELADFTGVPNYSNIINTLDTPDKCFVFSDYQFHFFSYAIRLYSNISEENEVYIICGDEYQVIAKSFSEFLELYINNSQKLYFENK